MILLSTLAGAALASVFVYRHYQSLKSLVPVRIKSK